jgi:predicted SAM-dependent methyltransferase
LSAYLFEDKSCDVNLEIKVQVLLDIEKTISEGNVASEILKVEGLILIAMNRQKDNIQKKKNKTLEQIMDEYTKKNKKTKNPFFLKKKNKLKFLVRTWLPSMGG